MKRVPALLLFAMCIMAALACSPGSDEPTPGATSTATSTQTPPAATSPTVTTATAGPSPVPTEPGLAPTATLVPEQLSAEWIETEPTTFRVRVPEGTPEDETVYLSLLHVDVNSYNERVAMEPEGKGVYSATVDVGVGAYLRYTYDRWDGVGCCEDALVTRESLFTGDHVRYRLLLREHGVDVVEDVVPQWNDDEFEFEQATVSGRVTDAETGEPLMDVDVSIGGLHSSTRFDGTFTLEGLALGPQRAFAYTVTGDYLPAQVEFDLPASGTEGLEIALSETEMRTVGFSALMPEGTPGDAYVRLGGNLWQLGARSADVHMPAHPSSISSPALPVEDGVVTGEFELPVGAYVEYGYLIGTQSAPETESYARKFRSFIVGEETSERVDRVGVWANEGWPLVTIRLTVPENTPPGVPVYFTMGPGDPMRQVGPYEYVAVIGSMPPGAEARFRFNLGDDMFGTDGSSAANEDGERVLIIPDESGEMEFEVESWKYLPDPDSRNVDGSLDVTFRLSLPLTAPAEPNVLLFGDRPAIDSDGVDLQQIAGNPWLYETTVTFDHDGALNYSFRDGDSGETLLSGSIETSHDGQIVNDYVSSWNGSAPESRDGWISGIFTPDFWSESFLAQSPSAFDAATRANGEWVAISSVWSFGQIQPYPTIEARPQRIWSVLTPIEDIRDQAAIAREKGLKVFLAPQMNPEVHPGWQDQTVSVGSSDWWEKWLEEAEAQWMWNALIGEEIGAEMLMLPGYVFHVFPPTGFFDDPEYVPEFDLKVQELIGKVREVYSGKIMMSGGQRDYDFPALADVLGVTTYDIGPPVDVPADATVEDLIAYYEPRFEEKVDSIWDRWGKPVMFYTIHAPAKAQEGDPYGQLFQANAHEAMFQLIAERPFVTGSFTWAFSMNGVTDFLTDGVRGRTGEAVLAKWYETFSGS